MKQKNLRYALLVGVALVWGIVIYRIIRGLNPNSPDLPSLSNKTLALSPHEKEDSFFLYMNYPDPFIPETDTSAINPAIGNTTPIGQPIQPPYLSNGKAPEQSDISFIKYYGMIYNPSRKIRAALISINNREITLREKENADKLTLKKIQPDKIQVLYNHKMYTIFKLN